MRPVMRSRARPAGRTSSAASSRSASRAAAFSQALDGLGKQFAEAQTGSGGEFGAGQGVHHPMFERLFQGRDIAWRDRAEAQDVDPEALASTIACPVSCALLSDPA